VNLVKNLQHFRKKTTNVMVVTSDCPKVPQNILVGNRGTLGDKDMFEHRIANIAMDTAVMVLGAVLAIPFFVMMYAPFAPGL
jgi:hypothetical protein